MSGYVAALSGFSNDLQDRHIGFNFVYRTEGRHWSGIIPSLRGGRYVVQFDEFDRDVSLLGATMESCDGQPIDVLARERLGAFKANWAIQAQRERAAPSLLVDDGNPFLQRPDRCRFVQNGTARDVKLDWKPVTRSQLAPLIRQAANYGEAGFGIREFEGGIWIALEAFDERVEPILTEARLRERDILAARRIVIDLRGNGGGNDAYGRSLAKLLFGGQRVEAEQGSALGKKRCETVWRVSTRNISRLRELSGLVSDPETREIVSTAIASVTRARAAGRELSGEPVCPPVRSDEITSATVPAKGAIFLLTDNACFSSCLSVARLFRQLGVMHVGQPTNANTHYSEVRGDLLPSGLATFQTLQALIPDAPKSYGPFAPDVTYAGDMADTKAIESWILALEPPTIHAD